MSLSNERLKEMLISLDAGLDASPIMGMALAHVDPREMSLALSELLTLRLSSNHHVAVLGDDWVFVTEGLPGWLHTDPASEPPKYLVLLGHGGTRFASYDLTTGWLVQSGPEDGFRDFRKARVIAWRCIPVPDRPVPTVLQAIGRGASPEDDGGVSDGKY